jgi:hypothetical protein
MSLHIPERQFCTMIDESPAEVKSQPMLDSISRRETLSSESTERVLALRVAETRQDRDAAANLINRRFAWRGYGTGHEIPSQDSHTTFIAVANEEVVGTITLGVDSPDGLGIDSVFRDEIDVFRNAPGALVCELTKFAFETELPDQQNLAMLFHTVFLYGLHKHRCTDLFIEVNPRHKRFYQAMLGFTPIGDLRTNHTVDAPSQLMWLNVSEIAANIASYRSSAGSFRSRSLYSLFLSQCEESTVKNRLKLRDQYGSMEGFNLIERNLTANPLRGLAA